MRRVANFFMHLARLIYWRVRLRIWPTVVFAAAVFLLAGVALTERARVTWRRMRGKRPRLVWGHCALLNIKYWSEGLKSRGWESHTCVSMPNPLAEHGDFDAYRDELVERSRLPKPLRQYAFFIWALRRGDVHLSNFDLGYLASTNLAWHEYRFLRLAGKKLVVYPYGGDIAVIGHLGRWHDDWLADYPQLVELAPQLERRVRYGAEWADASIRSKQVGFMPSYNVMWMHQLSIDASEWEGGQPSNGDGRNGEQVTIIHAPNHRRLKGTEFLERAVEELREEGLQVELRLIEGVGHDELRKMILETDIVGDQFTDGAYAMFALEGMAAGKPVLGGRGDLDFAAQEAERGCPVVYTNPERLKEDLRELVTDPERRRELGQAGREFVRRYHSHDAISADWEAVIEFAWRGQELPPHLRPR